MDRDTDRVPVTGRLRTVFFLVSSFLLTGVVLTEFPVGSLRVECFQVHPSVRIHREVEYTTYRHNDEVDLNLGGTIVELGKHLSSVKSTREK